MTRSIQCDKWMTAVLFATGTTTLMRILDYSAQNARSTCI